MPCSHFDKRSGSGDGGGGRCSATSTTMGDTGDGVSDGSSDDRVHIVPLAADRYSARQIGQQRSASFDVRSETVTVNRVRYSIT